MIIYNTNLVNFNSVACVSGSSGVKMSMSVTILTLSIKTQKKSHRPAIFCSFSDLSRTTIINIGYCKENEPSPYRWLVSTLQSGRQTRSRTGCQVRRACERTAEGCQCLVVQVSHGVGCAGLGPTVARYVPALRERGLDGAKLLTLRCDDLEYLGMHVIGHQELLLEAVEHLRNFVSL